MKSLLQARKVGWFKIIKISTRKIPLSDDVDLSKLLKVTEGFSGADISGLCREAALNVLRNGNSKVSAEDFKEALKLWGMKTKAEKGKLTYTG